MKLVKRKSNCAQKQQQKREKKSGNIKFSEFVVHKKFQSYTASFSEDKLCSRQYIGKPQFSSTAGLGNKMKVK